MLCGTEGWNVVDIKYAAALIQRAHNFKTGATYTYKGLGKTISLFPIDKEQMVIQAYFRNSDQSRIEQTAVLTKKYLKPLISALNDFKSVVIGRASEPSFNHEVRF